VYVCLGYVKKAYATGYTSTLRVLVSNFLGATGMMAHLDVLKFTPSPKKGSLDSGIFGNGLGMGIVRMCYMEMGFELATTPFHGRTNCVFLFGWTISSLVKLTLHFPRSCLVSPVALGSLLVFIFIISMYFSFLFFFFGKSSRLWEGKTKNGLHFLRSL